MKLKKLLATALLAVGILSLVACGNNSKIETKTSDSKTEKVTEASKVMKDIDDTDSEDAKDNATDSDATAKMKTTSDGTEIAKSSDGSVVLTYKDKTALTLAKDGSYVLAYANGTNVTKASDGSYAIVLANGTSIAVQSNASFVITDASAGAIQGDASDIKKVNDKLADAGYKNGLKTFDQFADEGKKLASQN